MCRIVSDDFMMKRQMRTLTLPLGNLNTLQSRNSSTSIDNIITPCFSVNYSTPVNKERDSSKYEQEFNILCKKKMVPVPDKSDKTLVDTELDCL